jgi:hypothetical protein
VLPNYISALIVANKSHRSNEVTPIDFLNKGCNRRSKLTGSSKKESKTDEGVIFDSQE